MKNCPLAALESMWFYELVAARLEVTQHDRVLDIGCGSGYACFKFAEQARQVIGVDISAPLIKYLATFDRPDNLEFLLHDACTEAFATQYRNYFSRVCSSDVLEHVADPARFASAVSQVLAEDGRAVLTFPNRQDHGRHHFDTPAEVEALFAGAGLAADVRAIKASSIYGLVWDIYSLARLLYKRVTSQKPDSAYKPSEDVFHHYSLFEQMTHPQWYHGVARRVMLVLMAVSKLGPLYKEIDVEPNGNIRGYRLLVTVTQKQGHD